MAAPATPQPEAPALRAPNSVATLSASDPITVSTSRTPSVHQPMRAKSSAQATAATPAKMMPMAGAIGIASMATPSTTSTTPSTRSAGDTPT